MTMNHPSTRPVFVSEKPPDSDGGRTKPGLGEAHPRPRVCCAEYHGSGCKVPSSEVDDLDHPDYLRVRFPVENAQEREISSSSVHFGGVKPSEVSVLPTRATRLFDRS